MLYLPDDPGHVWLDWFWQQHYASALAMMVAAILGITDALKYLAWRRRQAFAILRDDYQVPRLRPGATPTLTIDTSPRLWDRELDG